MNGKMNPDIREQWAAALESGDYQQGYEQLCIPTATDLEDAPLTEWIRKAHGDVRTYCCYGVLCELAVKAGIINPGIVVTDGDANDGCAIQYDGATLMLPWSVASWAGITFSDGTEDVDVTTDSGNGTSLARLNDTKHPFTEIAAIIREQL